MGAGAAAAVVGAAAAVAVDSVLWRKNQIQYGSQKCIDSNSTIRNKL